MVVQQILRRLSKGRYRPHNFFVLYDSQVVREAGQVVSITATAAEAFCVMLAVFCWGKQDKKMSLCVLKRKLCAVCPEN